MRFSRVRTGGSWTGENMKVAENSQRDDNQEQDFNGIRWEFTVCWVQ